MGFENRLGMRGLLLAAVVLASTGCYKATFVNPAVTPGVEHDEWTDFFIFGIIGDEEIDVTSFCGQADAAEVRTGGNFWTSLVGLVTIGIYAPRKVYVTCAAGPAQSASTQVEIDLGEDGRPLRVTRREGGRVLVGTPERIGDGSGLWRVALAPEEGAL